MNMRPVAHLFLIAGMLIPISGADCCKDAAAVVSSLTGAATISLPGAKVMQLSKFDWLPKESIIELSKEASAILILLNGHQYELRAGAKAKLTAEGLMRLGGVGKVQELQPLGPMPKFTPIADVETTAAAVRVRGSRIQNLYPHLGTLALASNVTLRFSAVAGASLYDIALEEDGDEILNLRDTSTSVPVPGNLLKPGMQYSWRVQAIGNSGVLAAAAAEFTTISQGSVQERDAFADALKRTDDASRLALMGAIDLRLGLIAEACEEFGQAQRLKPGDAELQRSLDSARKALGGAK
jgi:hypothetical protein